MEEYLIHSVKWYNFDILMMILESSYILPRCMLKEGIVTDTNNIFNGTKYISLTQKGGADGGRSSYDELVVDNPCLVLKRDNLDLVYPRYVDQHFVTAEEWRKIIFKDDDERHSYYEDELQTKNPISLKSNLVAVGLPVNYLRHNYEGITLEDTLDRVVKILKKNNLDVPIVNSSDYNFADNAKEIERTKILK